MSLFYVSFLCLFCRPCRHRRSRPTRELQLPLCLQWPPNWPPPRYLAARQTHLLICNVDACMYICVHVCIINVYTLGSKNRTWALRAISKKIPPLIWRRPNFMFQMQDFESCKWPKKSLRGIKGAGFPSKNCHFALSFIFFKKYFPKKIQKECAGHYQSTL